MFSQIFFFMMSYPKCKIRAMPLVSYPKSNKRTHVPDFFISDIEVHHGCVNYQFTLISQIYSAGVHFIFLHSPKSYVHLYSLAFNVMMRNATLYHRTFFFFRTRISHNSGTKGTLWCIANHSARQYSGVVSQ